MLEKVVLISCVLALTKAAYRGPLAGGSPAHLYPAGVDPKTCPNFPDCSNPSVAAIQAYRSYQSASQYTPQQYVQAQSLFQPRHTVTPIVEPEFEFRPTSAKTQQFTPYHSYAPPQQNVHQQQQVNLQEQQFLQHTGPQVFSSPQPEVNVVQPQFNAPQHQFNAPQHQFNAPPSHHNAAPSREDSYTPEQRRALNRGEYIGDGDYHGEGLDEALAPEYHGEGSQQQSYHQAAAAGPAINQYDTPAYRKVSAYLAQTQNVHQTPTTGSHYRNY